MQWVDVFFLMLVVTIRWKRTRVWILVWLCMLRVSFSFCVPHIVNVSALSIFICDLKYCVRLLYTSFVSRCMMFVFAICLCRRVLMIWS